MSRSHVVHPIYKTEELSTNEQLSLAGSINLNHNDFGQVSDIE
jgi:hypothetical protein